jgi:uncharacterized protein
MVGITLSVPEDVKQKMNHFDDDKVSITKTALDKKSNLTIGFATNNFLEVDGRKIFLTHYPVLAKPMAKSGDCDAFFYSHNHYSKIDKINKCIVVNQGEISAHKTSTASFALYDTKKNEAKIIEITGIITTKESSEYLDKI